MDFLFFLPQACGQLLSPLPNDLLVYAPSNTGDELVLIDTGTGGKLDEEPEFHGAGHLIANLRAAGYRPEQVDAILVTHRGQDHIGGLTVGNERAFPNAVVWAPKSEFDTFLDPARTSAVLAEAHHDEKVRAWLDFTRELFEPYIEAGKFRSFESDETLVPGIRSLATHGHTPGHTSYIVESRGRTLIVMGDLVLMGALQFAHPSLGSSFDVDAKAAAVQRQRVLQMSSEKDYWLAGGHLSFPCIGHVKAASGGYVWIPINYSIPEVMGLTRVGQQAGSIAEPRGRHRPASPESDPAPDSTRPADPSEAKVNLLWPNPTKQFELFF